MKCLISIGRYFLRKTFPCIFDNNRIVNVEKVYKNESIEESQKKVCGHTHLLFVWLVKVLPLNENSQKLQSYNAIKAIKYI